MIPSDKLIVSSTEPTGKNRKKVWIQKGKNLLIGIIPGYEFSNSQSGNVNVNENWFITEFIPVEGGKPYYVQGFSNNTRWWFDENKNFISFSVENPYSAPSNAKYLRLNGEISSSSNMMISQGDTEAIYEPYIEPKVYIKNNNDVYEEFQDDEIQELKSIVEDRIVNVNHTIDLNEFNSGFSIFSITYNSASPLNLDGNVYTYDNTRVMGFSVVSDEGLVAFQIGIITYSNGSSLIGKLIYRYRHGGSYNNNWVSLN